MVVISIHTVDIEHVVHFIHTIPDITGVFLFIKSVAAIVKEPV